MNKPIINKFLKYFNNIYYLYALVFIFSIFLVIWYDYSDFAIEFKETTTTIAKIENLLIDEDAYKYKYIVNGNIYYGYGGFNIDQVAIGSKIKIRYVKSHPEISTDYFYSNLFLLIFRYIFCSILLSFIVLGILMYVFAVWMKFRHEK